MAALARIKLFRDSSALALPEAYGFSAAACEKKRRGLFRPGDARATQ